MAQADDDAWIRARRVEFLAALMLAKAQAIMDFESQQSAAARGDHSDRVAGHGRTAESPRRDRPYLRGGQPFDE